MNRTTTSLQPDACMRVSPQHALEAPACVSVLGTVVHIVEAGLSSLNHQKLASLEKGL